jgi:ABC-2 type transport system ATP-binding protein
LTSGGSAVHIHQVMNKSAVSIDDLVVVRGGRPVLDHVTVEVRPGSITGLLGPSGCGKSTLMRSIVGVQKIAGGTVEVLGQPAGSGPLRRQVGYVTQAPSVYGDLTVRQNLTYFARVLDAPGSDVARVLDETGLTDHADQLTAQLSGGQLARVSLAGALLGEPRLLVLDEPTVGLDPVLRRDLWDLFHALASRGVTLLVSSHVMDEAVRCDELILMRDGRILAYDTPSALLERTGTHDIEHAFLRLVEQSTSEVPA